jgi:hypothetical protein
MGRLIKSILWAADCPELSVSTYERARSRYNWLSLAEGHLTRRRLGAMLGRIELLADTEGILMKSRFAVRRTGETGVIWCRARQTWFPALFHEFTKPTCDEEEEAEPYIRSKSFRTDAEPMMPARRPLKRVLTFFYRLLQFVQLRPAVSLSIGSRLYWCRRTKPNPSCLVRPLPAES